MGKGSYIFEGLLVSVLVYRDETVVWREKERCRITAAWMNKSRDLLGISKMESTFGSSVG